MAFGLPGAIGTNSGSPARLFLTIAANTANYNVRAQAVATAGYVANKPLDITVTINSAVLKMVK